MLSALWPGVSIAGSYLCRRGFANSAIAAGKVLHSAPDLDKKLFAFFDSKANRVVYIAPSQRQIILRTGSAPPRDLELNNS